MDKIKCWEFKKCDREKGGANADELGVCPAYPDNGRECWTVGGTLCDGVRQGRYSDKIITCMHCNYFRANMDDDV